jgi:hypothetical protein
VIRAGGSEGFKIIVRRRGKIICKRRSGVKAENRSSGLKAVLFASIVFGAAEAAL